MNRTRYREARTLARGLCCLPREDRKHYQLKISKLRKHFRRFNLDSSELCQWLMSIRPEGKFGSVETKSFWELMIEPEFKDEDEENTDRYRRMIFDVAIGLENEKSLGKVSISKELLDSTVHVATLPRTASADALFKRLSTMNPAHRQVLIKASAEWILTRYKRGYDNRVRNCEEWEKEKRKWEEEHPELTPSVIQEFNKILDDLGIKLRKPRICDWKKLENLSDNCTYTGELIDKIRHSPLCKKYSEFRKEHFKNTTYKSKLFESDAEKYFDLLRRFPQKTPQEVLKEFEKKYPKSSRFKNTWAHKCPVKILA